MPQKTLTKQGWKPRLPPLGTQWVTEAEMTAFTNAIGEAETAKNTATSQAAINSAKTRLDTAIETFNNAKKPGTAAPVNTSALTAKIAEAEAARAGVQQASGAGGEAYYIKVWPQTDWDRGTYQITFSTSDTPPPPSGAAPVTQLTADTWAAGNLPENGVQWFKFTSTVTGEQYIHFESGTLHWAHMQVYNGFGNTVGSEFSSDHNNITVTNGQEYYIKVWAYSEYDSGTYRIAFNTRYDPPEGN
jgi:hypothetical protein